MLDDVVIPDLAEPIKAWRVFKFNARSGLFGSMGHRWPAPYEMTAVCHSRACTEPPCSPGEVWEGKKRMYTIRRENSGLNYQQLTTSGLLDGIHHIGDGCGIYGYKRRSDAFEEASRIASQCVGFMDIFVARVWLWGKVYEYEGGYRAQHARIQALYEYHNTTSEFLRAEFDEARKDLMIDILRWED